MLYADDRGVSRVYAMTLVGDQWRMWRDNAEFAQRFTATISAGRGTIDGQWEKRVSGGEWVLDFTLSYRRLP